MIWGLPEPKNRDELQMVSRIEPELTDHYRKDDNEERFLELLNNRLELLDESLYVNVESPPPSIFVLGLPRSGTTLISQAISSYFNIGCVSNLMATFWKAPICGLRLSQKLSDAKFQSDFQSDYGRTAGLFEPHEFGYFWSSVLSYKELAKNANVDLQPEGWTKLALVLNNIAHEYGAPFLHKNILFNWHAAELARQLPNAIFVVAVRDKADAALSLLNMRKRMLGGEQYWASAKPAAFERLKGMNECHQVAGQVHFLQQELDEQLDEIAGNRVLRIGLKDFCADPSEHLNSIEAILNDHAKVTIKRRNFDLPSLSYKAYGSADTVHHARITAAIAEFEVDEKMSWSEFHDEDN